MWVLRGLPCGIGWIGAGCHRGVMCTFLLTLQGQPYVGAGGDPSNYHPSQHSCPNKNRPSKHTHLMAIWQGGCCLGQQVVCVCVLLGVCSSNKGKQCVLHCLIRWLCSALSAFLISVCVCRCCGGAGWLLDCGSSGERRFRDGPHLCLRTISMQWVCLRLRNFRCFCGVFDLVWSGYTIRQRVCVFVYVCVALLLPTPLEMLGCPARLFLDQWQRVNGCRCIAKEGSEIPTDPGRSFPIFLYLPACMLSYL